MTLDREVIEPPPELVEVLQNSLANEISRYDCLLDSIAEIDKEIALLLASTQGAMLTTMRGTGMTLAAGALHVAFADGQNTSLAFVLIFFSENTGIGPLKGTLTHGRLQGGP